MNLDESEIRYLRKRLYEELMTLPELVDTGWAPEAKDFERVKKPILSEVAYKIWEKLGKPTNQEIDIWLQAEEVWNFIRYMW